MVGVVDIRTSPRESDEEARDRVVLGHVVNLPS